VRVAADAGAASYMPGCARRLRLTRTCDWGILGAAVECLDMLSLDEYHALVHADARDAAERRLRCKFGRLSNRRILSVLRPAADQVDELRGRSDRDLLDDWFMAFTLHRKEIQSVSWQKRCIGLFDPPAARASSSAPPLRRPR
jgi:hypothetical protein